jgi:hypothetical protein
MNVRAKGSGSVSNIPLECQIRLVLLNAQSLKNKYIEFKNEVVLFHRFPEVIAVTETWFNNAVPVGMFGQGVYTEYRRDRSGDPHGGVVLYVSSTIPSDLVHASNDIELLWVRLYIGGIVLIVGVYYHPNVTLTSDVDFLREELGKIRLLFPTATTLLVGDFNLPDINWELQTSPHSYRQDEYLALFSEFNLSQVVEVPTRGENILDLILTSERYCVNSVRAHPPLAKSDHRMLECEFSWKLSDNANNVTKRRCWSLAKWASIREKLKAVNWWDVFTETDMSNVEAMWNKFKSSIFAIADEHVPIHTAASLDRLHRLPKPIHRAIRAKRSAYGAYRRRRTNENKTKYLLAVTNLRSKLKASEARRERSIIRNPNCRKFHRSLNSKMNHKPRIDAIYGADGTVTNDKAEMVDLFSEYFKSVFAQPGLLHNMHVPHAGKDFYVTRSDVRKAISECIGKSSVGCDGIPNVLYKQCCEELCLPLQLMFSVSLSTGEIPKDWLTSATTPIYKKGSRLEVKNHRPVSLTVTACRILERIIKDHLIKFIFRHDLVSVNQHGFLPRRSTLTNLLVFIDEISRNLDAGVSTNAVYLDIAKAFDKIPHDRLIARLMEVGVDDSIVNWVKVFLTERKQYVMIGGQKSSLEAVTSGVPQGSVLGPVLFVLFFESFSCDRVGVLKFADDTKLFSANAHILQEELSKFANDLELGGLQIAVDKCAVVNFSHTNQDDTFYLNGSILESLKSIRDLGVMIDSKLTFSEHCQQIANRAASLNFRILKSFCTNEPAFLFSVFCTYVRPILERDSPAWSPYLKRDILIAESPQRRFTKRLSGLRDLSYLERLYYLGADTLLVRRMKTDLLLVYKILHNVVDALDHLLEINPNDRTRGHRFKLKIQRHRTITHALTFFCNTLRPRLEFFAKFCSRGEQCSCFQTQIEECLI